MKCGQQDGADDGRFPCNTGGTVIHHAGVHGMPRIKNPSGIGGASLRNSGVGETDDGEPTRHLRNLDAETWEGGSAGWCQ
jgi:hypothetical protein